MPVFETEKPEKNLFQKYTKNYLKMNEKYPDLSEYEKFASNICKYIELFLMDIDDNFLNSVCNGLHTFKTEYPLKISYQILYTILKINSSKKNKVTDCLSKETMRNHLKSSVFIKNEIYNLLSILNTDFMLSFNDIIDEDIQDENYFGEGLKEIIKIHGLWNKIYVFLANTDETFLRKKLKICIELFNELDINLDDYVKHFGHSHSDICFYIEELFKTALKSQKQIVSSIFDIQKEDSSYFFTFRQPISVGSAENFVFYFFNFFEEKNEVIDFLKSKDFYRLKRILDNYLSLKEGDNYIPNDRKIGYLINNSVTKNIRQEKFENDIFEYLNFDHLFDSVFYQSKIDCIEI